MVCWEVHLTATVWRLVEKWGRGEGIRRWLYECFEFLSHSGFLGSARSIRNLSHPWSLSSSGGLHTSGRRAQTWTEAERMLLPDRGVCETAIPFSPPRSPSCRAVGWAIAEEHSFHMWVCERSANLSPGLEEGCCVCVCVCVRECTREIKWSSRQSPGPVGLYSSFIMG